MKFIKKDGFNIPVIGFGTYEIGDDETKAMKELEVLEYGFSNYKMQMIDTAEMYGNGKSENLISKFIATHKREDLYIIDKILPENAENNLYLESCIKSLKRLKTTYIDLYLLHWRANVDLQDMVNNMEKLVEYGLIKRWGVSNFDVSDMEELFKCDKGSNCFLNQCLYNLSERGVEYDLIPWCEKHNVLFMAYSPIAHNNFYKSIIKKSDEIQSLSKNQNESIESLMLRFVIRNNNVITAFKTSNVKHLISNMKNVFIPLSDYEMKVLDCSFPKPNKKIELQKI